MLISLSIFFYKILTLFVFTVLPLSCIRNHLYGDYLQDFVDSNSGSEKGHGACTSFFLSKLNNKRFAN